MKTVFALVLASVFGSSAPAQIAVQLDPRGTLNEVKVGDAVYLGDVAVSLVKPGWTGNLADQRNVDPGTVHVYKQGATTTYTMPLKGDSFSGQLIERVTRTDDAVELRYEVIPDRDVEIETVLLRGSLATASHAGKTSYLVGGSKAARGILPTELNAEKYVLWRGEPAWLGFAAPGVGGLRVVPRDMGIQLQDDRKWNTPAFAMLATAGGGEHLMRKPIRFGLSLRAEAAGRLDDELKRGAAVGVRQTDDRPLAIRVARIDRDRLGVFSTLTVDADVQARYDNPFDPDEIAVDGEVATPDGKLVTVPGYFQTPFQIEDRRGTENLKVAGASGFRVRYTPIVAGPHTITIKVKDRTGEVRSAPLAFVAEDAKAAGFVRVAPKSPHYFAFDDGGSYFAIGENVCWGRRPRRRWLITRPGSPGSARPAATGRGSGWRSTRKDSNGRPLRPPRAGSAATRGSGGTRSTTPGGSTRSSAWRSRTRFA